MVLLFVHLFFCACIHAQAQGAAGGDANVDYCIVDFLVRGLLKKLAACAVRRMILMLVCFGPGIRHRTGHMHSIEMCSRFHLKICKDANGSSNVILFIH